MIFLIPSSSIAIEINDYIIDSDIGMYKRSYPGSCPIGSCPLSSAGHFKRDHTDYSCDIRYFNKTIKLGVEVQITQHPGSQSDEWLLHEVEKSFRTYYGMPGDPLTTRIINGNTILFYGSAGGTYRWVSNQKVIEIEYYDSQMTKPEPLEVVRAYLVKHPSTLTPVTSAALRTDENKTSWIKTEMDRRLWLCDKWLGLIVEQNPELSDKLENVSKSLIVFLNYRENYFGVSAKDDKRLIYRYREDNNEIEMRARVEEYKQWWNDNRNGAIKLP